MDAFCDCEKLTEVELSEDIERNCRPCIFLNCPHLRRITMPLKDNLLLIKVCLMNAIIYHK